jgi:hypothetical protein
MKKSSRILAAQKFLSTAENDIRFPVSAFSTETPSFPPAQVSPGEGRLECLVPQGVQGSNVQWLPMNLMLLASI